MLEIIVITALVVSTILLALRKMGALDWYGSHFGHIKWLPDAGCYLCLGFWVAGLVFFPLAIYSLITWDLGNALLLILIPFASTALSTLITHEIIKD